MTPRRTPEGCVGNSSNLRPEGSFLDREFTDDSGSVIGLRSALTGIRFPFPAGEAGFADFTNCFAPQRERRMWAVARHDLEPLLTQDDHGKMRIFLPGNGFDFGNYRQGWARVYATILNAAHEFGDEEIAAAAQRSLDLDCGRRDDAGILRYAKASNLSNTFAVRPRIVRRDDFRNAVTQGPPRAVFMQLWYGRDAPHAPPRPPGRPAARGGAGETVDWILVAAPALAGAAARVAPNVARNARIFSRRAIFLRRSRLYRALSPFIWPIMCLSFQSAW